MKRLAKILLITLALCASPFILAWALANIKGERR